MSGVLILEDDLEHIREFQRALPGLPLRIVHEAKNAVYEMNRGTWDFIFLNHCKKNGPYVCAWAAEHTNKFKGCTFIINTVSPVMAKRMHGLLFRASLHVHCRCRAWSDTALMQYITSHLKKTSPGSI